MWNDVQGQIKDFVQMLLKPVAMFHNPFYKRPHKLILCDTWLTDEEPAGMYCIIFQKRYTDWLVLV